MIAGAQWTEKLYPRAGGQDHLGLGSVSSDRILPKLSPGIVVQTVHPRYVSFYTFLLDEFWRRDLPRSRTAFSRFYRPREAIFAIGAQLCDQPEHGGAGAMQGVVGSIKAGSEARSGRPIFDAGFDYIKDDLGGYGLYYGAVISEFGLTVRTNPAAGVPYDAPTPEGRRLAEAFRSVVMETAYYKHYFDFDDAQVPRETVLEYIRAACLCQLEIEAAPDRPLLRDVYLHAGSEESAAERRDTLRVILDLADQTGGQALTEDRFRQLIYYRSDSGGATWQPATAVVRMARRWRLYQAREYYAFALNRLWRYLAEWGQGRVSGDGDVVSQSSWWEELEVGLRSAALSTALGIPDPGFDGSSRLDDLAKWVVAQGHVEVDLDAPWDIGAPVTEHALYRFADRSTDPGIIAAALTILGLVAARLGPPREMEMAYPHDWDLCLDGGVARLALSRFFNQWRQRVRSGATIGAAARWLMEDYVIRQHERIAISKLGQTGDTFRFRREGDRFRFYFADTPARMTSSRFQALATSAHELGFVRNLFAPQHPLTGDGAELLQAGDLLTASVEPPAV